MDMDMGHSKAAGPLTQPRLSTAYFSCLVALLAGLVPGHAGAEGWGFRPNVTLSSIYTDNVDLKPSGEADSDMILLAAPGFSLQRETSRLKLEADYQLQALAFAESSSEDRINHELKGLMNAELQPDFLFLDASARLTQVSVDARAPRAMDNVTSTVNRRDAQAYQISPYIHHDLSGYATTLLRYGYEWVDTDGAVEVSETNYVDANLSSGRHFGLLSWNLNYFKREDDRGGTFDIEEERSNASIAYRVLPSLSLLAEAGRENNDLGSNELAQNGSYWAAGAAWTPNRYISLSAMDGDRFTSGTVSLTPSPRSSLMVSYRDRDVGFNPGVTWTGRLQHKTRRSVWQLDYFEDTQTSQRLLLTGPIFDLLNPDGTVGGKFIPHDSLSLTDEIFERKRTQGSVSYQTGKSIIAIAAYREQRNILLGSSTDDSNVRGGLAEWTWQFTGLTQSRIRGNWERIDFLSDARQDDFWYLDTMLTRSLSGRTSASLGYRHTRRDSTQATAEYAENRIYATLFMEF
jgi:uncharacterized protein (PEP-CTERM system associated)